MNNTLEVSADEIKEAMIKDWEKYGYCPKYDEYCPCDRYRDYIQGFFDREFGGWAQAKKEYDLIKGEK